MRFLVVFCHPSEESFSAALNNLVCKTLQKSDHQIRLLDLYRIDFNPVLSKNEWNVYLDDTQQIIKNVQNGSPEGAHGIPRSKSFSLFGLSQDSPRP